MFENQQHQDIEALIDTDADFRRLYQRHRHLKSKVHDAEIGALPMDPLALSSMKREKLYTKDRLQRLWDARPTH